MAQLCNLQKSLSERILKLYTNTKKTSKSRYTQGYLETRLETLDGYWSKYQQQHEEITSTIPASDLEKFEFDAHSVFDATEDVYLDFKTLLKDCLSELTKPELNVSNSDNLNSTACEHTKPITKLPTISIPKFSGNYNDWMSFKDLFISLVHNNKHITNIEKHHYLRTSLSGEAEQLLKHFALTESNYEKAWNTLENRFDNKRMIVTTIISRLMNQKKMSTECSRSLKELLDTTKECMNSLDNLNIQTSSWDAIIVYVVVSKLDIETHRQWEHSLGSSRNIPTFELLASFLENRFRSMEMISATHKSDFPTRKDFVKISSHHKPTSNNIKSFVTEVNSTCTYCTQNHYICHCKEFAQLEVEQRQDFVKKNGICFNCLVKGHSVNSCRQSTTCRKCNRRHHTLLHYTNPNKNSPVPEHNPPTTATSETCKPSPIVGAKAEVQNAQVILPTAQIACISRNNETVILRALIDQGSQASFITEAAAQSLNLERTSVNGKVTGITSSTLTTKSMVNLKFTAVRDKSQQITVEAYVLERLTSLLPSREFPLDTWPSFETSELADPNFHKPGSIDVLLGADVHAHIILDRLRRHDSLIALNSRLGWLISGRVAQTDSHSHHVVIMHAQIEVDQLLIQCWETDDTPSVKPLSQLETQCEEHVKDTHTRNTDVQYEMEKRGKHKPNFREQYCKFMRQYESQGHMEIVPEKELNNKTVCYSPHYAVLRESSLTGQLRTVSALHTEEDTVRLQGRLTGLLKRPSWFVLHKWSSSSEKVLSEISDSQKVVQVQSSVSIKMDHPTKALRIAWKALSARFELVVNLPCDDNVKKRIVLSPIAKTFDRLGWLAPIVIVLKIFIQRWWLAGLSWDNKLSNYNYLKTERMSYLTNYKHMTPIQFPRWLSACHNNVQDELVVFITAFIAMVERIFLST